MARVFTHQDLIDLAVCSMIPVINGLSDRSHPCQVLADLLTLREHFGHLDGLRIAYIGDANNILHPLVIGAALSGIALTVATPPEYAPSTELIESAAQRGLTVDLCVDPREAVRNADAVYTDTWVSMGQEAESAIRLPILRRIRSTRICWHWRRPCGGHARSACLSWQGDHCRRDRRPAFDRLSASP